MISDQLLFVLKLLVLALLYLFFFRVVRAVWTEIRPVSAGAAPMPGAPTAPRRARDERAAAPTSTLVVREPVELAGRVYELADEVSLGRAAGCQITLDDTYASQIHARLHRRDGQWMLEDLGSTNGTWLNRHKVGGAMVVKPGDVIQIGNTVLELR